eukprot:3074095-Amphidinium_carterae.1
MPRSRTPLPCGAAAAAGLELDGQWRRTMYVFLGGETDFAVMVQILCKAFPLFCTSLPSELAA